MAQSDPASSRSWIVSHSRALSLISGHLDEAAASEVRRLSETLGPLESRVGHKFRDLGLSLEGPGQRPEDLGNYTRSEIDFWKRMVAQFKIEVQ